MTAARVASDDMAAQLFVNPACSKCRTALGILGDAGVAFDEVRYLDAAPTVEELRRLMTLLGVDSPLAMIRTGEPDFERLGLGSADDQALLEAISAHPILLERPIFVVGDRAVIARPPERVRDLL